ncbi:MAG: prepilin-type N-terminal cleavage/methylation domain-containing protein [Verrucomicrobiota bacterium]
MKLPQLKQESWKTHPIRTRGFTLVEMMVAMAIMMIAIAALLSAHIIGLKQNQLIESKAGASDSSRRAIGKLADHIRQSKMWFIGNMSGTNFTAVSNGREQGTALALCETTNGSQFIYYYFDLSDTNNSNGKLVCTTSTQWNPVVLASNLINTLFFTAEDYNGVVQTNTWTSKSYKNVIHTTLQFRQFQYPTTTVGSNCLFDSYQLDFMATPHLPE